MTDKENREKKIKDLKNSATRGGKDCIERIIYVVGNILNEMRILQNDYVTNLNDPNELARILKSFNDQFNRINNTRPEVISEYCSQLYAVNIAEWIEDDSIN